MKGRFSEKSWGWWKRRGSRLREEEGFIDEKLEEERLAAEERLGQEERL